MVDIYKYTFVGLLICHIKANFHNKRTRLFYSDVQLLLSTAFHH